jgi:O-antigen/teichoic acid export membrane protein
MPNNLSTKVSSGLLWSAVRSWGSRLSSLAVFLVLSRLLTPYEFGLFAAATVIFLFFELFVDQGLSDALIQTNELDNELINAVFWLNIGFSIIVFFIVYLSAPYLAQQMKMPDLSQIIRIGSLSILINSTALCQQALYRREFKYKMLAVRSLIASLISGIFGCAFAFYGFGTYSLLIQFLILCTINAAYVWRYPVWKPALSLNIKPAFKLLGFSINAFLTKLLDFVSQKSIDIFIGYALGAVSLGFYSVGARLYLILMQMLSSVVLDVALSGFSRLSSQIDKLGEAYITALKISSAIAFPVFIFLSATASLVIPILFGSKWADSAYVFSALSLLGAVQVLQFYNGSCLNALGKSNLTLITVCFKILFAFISLVVFSKSGLEKLIIAFVIGQLLAAPISFYFGLSRLKLKVWTVAKAIFPYMVASALMWTGCYFIVKHFEATNKIPVLVLTMAASFIIYFASLFILFNKDYRYILSLFKNKFKAV